MITVMSRDEQRDAVLDTLRKDLAVDGTCDRRVLGYVQQILYALEHIGCDGNNCMACLRARNLVRQAYGVLDAHDIARNERREVSS